MKKFSKVLEDLNLNKYYEVIASIKLNIEAENEGEAGYVADSIIGSIKEQVDFEVKNIEEIDKENYKEYLEESYNIGFKEDESIDSDEDKILKTWDTEFGEKTPTTTQKMEFYHQMRTAGFDGEIIHKALSNKISSKWMENR